jgi:hypothetical protein
VFGRECAIFALCHGCWDSLWWTWVLVLWVWDWGNLEPIPRNRESFDRPPPLLVPSQSTSWEGFTITNEAQRVGSWPVVLQQAICRRCCYCSLSLNLNSNMRSETLALRPYHSLSDGPLKCRLRSLGRSRIDLWLLESGRPRSNTLALWSMMQCNGVSVTRRN